jgi:hypothetical protein
MKRKKKQRLIVDVDSTEDPAHGKQEHVAFTVTSERIAFILCSLSRVKVTACGLSSGPAPFIQPMVFWTFSLRS